MKLQGFLLFMILQISFAQVIENTRGGWFNFGIDGTGGSTSLNSDAEEHQMSGVGIGLHSRTGAMLTPIWILTMDVEYLHMPSPDYSIDGKRVSWSGNSLNQIIAGPGATVILDRDQRLTLGATLGAAYLFQMNSDYKMWDHSKIGFALGLRVGKDWTVNPGVLLGLTLGYQFAYAGLDKVGKIIRKEQSFGYSSHKIGLGFNLSFGNRCVLNPKETSKYRDCMTGY